MSTESLHRFIEAQEGVYSTALQEIRNGKKASHWMWFIFPQIAGLGRSYTAQYFAIKNLMEAEAFLSHPLLRNRLIEASETLLESDNDNATTIFGKPDDMKLRSSMTLFAQVPNAHPIFKKILDKFFGGAPDKKTLELIKTMP